MREFTLVREQRIARPIDEVFAFFAEPGNLQAITPGWLRFRILTPAPIRMEAGARIRYALRWRGIPVSWTTEIRWFDPPHGFIDEQVSGPYRLWHHTHRFEAVEEGTVMHDMVRYALPLGWVGRLARAGFVGRDLEAIFDFRARKVAEFFSTHGRS